MADWSEVNNALDDLANDLHGLQHLARQHDAQAIQADMREVRAHVGRFDGLTYQLAQESTRIQHDPTEAHPRAWLPFYLSKRDLGRAEDMMRRGERFRIFLQTDGSPGKPGARWIVCAGGIQVKAVANQWTAKHIADGLNQLSRGRMEGSSDVEH